MDGQVTSAGAVGALRFASAEDRRFLRTRPVADALMLEGCHVNPLRVSAPRHHLGGQAGVLGPPRWSEMNGGDAAQVDVFFLMQAEGAARLSGQFRFLQLRRREVERRVGAETRLAPTWDEGLVREVEIDAPLTDLAPGDAVTRAFQAPAGEEIELWRDHDGSIAGRILCDMRSLVGAVRVFSECLLPSRWLYRVQVRIENLSEGGDPEAGRTEALRTSLLSAHLLLAVEGGRFLSPADPPEWAADAARCCRNRSFHPALIEETPGEEVLFAGPQPPGPLGLLAAVRAGPRRSPPPAELSSSALHPLASAT